MHISAANERLDGFIETRRTLLRVQIVGKDRCQPIEHD